MRNIPGSVEEGTRLAYGLWASIGLTVILFAFGWRYTTGDRYLLAAELLLVFVLAVEGLAAFHELRLAKSRARFEALLSIYNFSREIHTLAFDDPTLWSAIGHRKPDDPKEKRGERYAQLFCNMHYLSFEAAKLHYIDADQWERDATKAVLRPEMKRFLLDHQEYYSKDFVAWFNTVFEEHPDPTGKAGEASGAGL
ncbi:MAG: hypothetical protein WCA49_24255 [Candidatus Sulfotelmatobacter sp.]